MENHSDHQLTHQARHGGMPDDHVAPWWRRPGGLVFIGFAAIAGFFLFTEHRAHLLGALPWLLLLGCPLMHIFMHHGHGHHHHGKSSPRSDATDSPASDDKGGQ